MVRILELLLHAVRARASYTTRVWTALFFPVLVGTLSNACTRLKVESLLVSVAVVTVYSVAYFVNKRYFR
jgi:hypothetical protein